MSSKRTFLVTGANRGIGFELVNQVLEVALPKQQPG